MAQPQQCASEWNKWMKELEVKLNVMHARLADTGGAKMQLDSVFSVVKMHLNKFWTSPGPNVQSRTGSNWSCLV